jgi:RNA polymerase subunit RPABC4/transcription elongation factor Spt4
LFIFEIKRFADMKKKECPSCAMEIDEKESVCPYCHYEFPSESKMMKFTGIIIIIIFIIFFVLRMI